MGPDEVSGRDSRGYRTRGEFWARPRSRIHSGFRLALAADWGQFGEVGEMPALCLMLTERCSRCAIRCCGVSRETRYRRARRLAFFYIAK
jgi:hypothetical protein